MTNFISAKPAQPNLVTRFQRDEKGNIAILFGLSLVPALLLMGAAIDYTRSSEEHTRLQSAVDATALMLAHEPKNTAPAILQAKGQKAFAANFSPNGGGPVPTISVSLNPKNVTVSAHSDVSTSLLKIGGQNAVDVGATSVVAYKKNIELALVLDNTGSMGQNGKIEALRASVNSLLTKLEATSQSPGDIKVSLVPFTTQVKIDKNFASAPWLRWDVTLENAGLSGSDRAPPTPVSWTGCLSDREQNYDAQSVPATGLQSKYPASKCQDDGLLPMAFLTQNLETVREIGRASCRERVSSEV